MTDRGEGLDYWRAEKADSVIVLPIQASRIICVASTFRPGVGYATLDFPGGRLPEGTAPRDIVPAVLERELGIPRRAIRSVEALNQTKWLVNSSFSNQGLWGFVADIEEGCPIAEGNVGAIAEANRAGLDQLLTKLRCLQCRAILLEWRQQGSSKSGPAQPLSS
jgi:hypothetical protein